MTSPIERVVDLPSDRSTVHDGTPASTPIRILTNKSCDFCRRRKRRCDGDGVNPCSRCKALPGSKCTFSQRKLHRSRRAQNRPTLSWVLNGQRRGLLGGGHSLIKRCQLSASPATGLVGTVENAQLKDFFGCMGFLQLASQSDVREAMVRIMTTSTSSSSRLSLGAGADGAATSDSTRESETTWLQTTTGLPMDAGACSFWCAIAIGGLVQGQPRDAIVGYVSKAKAALESCSSAGMTPEVARAFVQMALLNAMNGDKKEFRACEERALTILQDSAGNEFDHQLSQGLVYLVRHTEALRIYTGDYDKQDVENFVKMDLGPLPEVREAMTEEEMSQFVMHAYHWTGQAFYADVLENPQKVEFRPNVIEPLAYDFVEPIPSGRSEAFWDSGLGGGHGEGAPGKGPRPPGGNMQQVIREIVPVYERMRHAVERPCVRMGIGALVINTALSLSRAAMHDLEGAVELASRSVEAILTYPGIIRFDTGYHNIHLLMMLLSRSGSTVLYEKLRAVYNKYRPGEGRAVPPMEEWEGIACYCGHPYCTAAEVMMKSQEKLRAMTDIASEDHDATNLGLAVSSAGLGNVAHVLIGDTCQSENGSDSVYPELFADPGEGEMPSTVANMKVERLFWAQSSGYVHDTTSLGASTSASNSVHRSVYNELVGDVVAPEDWRIAADSLI